ncbi:4'-phosphopantetheinyl transferase superfamily [Cardinium endosymbiont of Sogatella furcifera]|uniref:4'-phosphopantetheinyl transferase family protein n=1 Tax=Cardinium endosymbiont of Sogatella furcifera TaxID=650378 RepID=UPI000E0D2BC3|nr:4'-phosphopantetheinyl transferase superfamily protein [Cardinium endosymbiont of Sogatella furcifera]AXI24104.1 4'-phosphopantetheinyl transferase superfamily [Cardinium endosymbiont of Sogatella furcifera]
MPPDERHVHELLQLWSFLSMPVYRFSVCAPHTFYLIWKIQESVGALYAQLPPQFLDDFHSNNLSFTDRQQQSLAVRVALCCLLKKLNLPLVSLSKNAQGRPILAGCHISFSHTRYLAAVALSTVCPIGIDIEIVKPSLHKVQKKFLTEAEAQDANHCLAKLAIYWCAKEALYKRLDQQATVKDSYIAPFQLQDEGKIIAYWHQKKYLLRYQCIADGAIEPHVLVYSQD